MCSQKLATSNPMSGVKSCLCVMVAAALLAGSAADEPGDSVASALRDVQNRERKPGGRAPFKLSGPLSAVATHHAKDMATHGKLDHQGSDGSSVSDRIKRKDYDSIRVGENVARGQKNAEEVVKAWMKSAGHRANILGDFTELGAGYFDDENGQRYWCAVYATPMPRFKPEDAAAAVTNLINRDRRAAQQPQLKEDRALARGAMALAKAIAARESLEFEGDPFSVIDDKDARGRELRLGLAAGAPTPAEAIKSLLAEDRDDLPTFREIGVGYAIGKSGTPYWCAFLAKPSKEKPPKLPATRAPAGKKNEGSR
jgi:uncharacterized protein YkwD